MTKKRSTQKKKGRELGVREFLLALLLIGIVWVANQLTEGDGPSDTPIVESERTGDVQVFFTTPRYPETAQDRHGGIDEKLAAAIDAAQKTVDVAAFELDLERVTDALVRADKRGVRVRLVTDSDYEEDYGPQTLLEADIPVVFDNREPFMHNKFVVIDGATVWAGSWNLTNNCTYRNNNNALVIQSQKLAQNYTAEFEEMFVDGKFGASSPDNTPHPQVEVAGLLLENFFEAEGDVRVRMIELLEQAESSIYFLAFSFTDDDIAQAMIKQHRAGLTVQGVFEKRNAEGTGSEFAIFQKAGIDVLADGNPYVMHHKVIIIDEAIVITGSYNFSASAANNNDENVLIVHSAEVAAQYLAEFKRVYQRAEQGE
ncbi:MAG TPA: phospholipase D-like domain-containing protein [Anaerolineae bacterium]|nr:phospholipase D-like domain-containing protein [Anaerolineae bacterium]